MPLTDIAVRAARPCEKAYKIADGQGMYLEVMPNGSKYWRLKYRIDGKEKRAALGVYPEVSLVAARKAREAVKDALRAGLDPASQKKQLAEKRIAEREQANPRTVADAMQEYRSKVSPKKEGCRAEQLRLERFERDFPDLAALPLSEFYTPHLATWRDARLNGYTRPDGTKARAVASSSVNREINLIRNVFVIARKEWKWLAHNPFEGLSLPPDGSARTRRVDPWKEVRPIVRWLGYRTGTEPVTKNQEVALAWLIALRTGMRASEILGLGKQTLNLKIKAAEVEHKMQYLTRAPRRIPLTRQAIRLLRVVASRGDCFTVSPDSMSTLFAKARKSLGIKGMTFHDSRGEALTRLSRKIDVLTLSKISGIKDIRILQEHYYRETPEQIAARL